MTTKYKFIRIQEDLYKQVQKHAKTERRSTQLMFDILLGFALNHYDQSKLTTTTVSSTLPTEGPILTGASLKAAINLGEAISDHNKTVASGLTKCPKCGKYTCEHR